MFMRILRWLTSAPLDRILDSIDRKVDSETERERIKADVISSYYASRASYMRAGGFWLMLIFVLPLGYWFASVCIYSVHWCADCANPQTWTIAALPAPLDEWAGGIIISIFGVVSFGMWRK
jgi:hypothetical protein